MSVLPSRDTPYLLNRIEIWRVWREFNEHYGIPDVLILRHRFLFNKTHGFLVPGSVIHHQGIFLSIRSRMFFDKRANRINGRGIVEHFRLSGKEDPALRDNESTIRCLKSTGERLNRRGAAFFVPARSNGS